MRRFKFIGTEEDAYNYSNYEERRPRKDIIYTEEDVVGGASLRSWWSNDWFYAEWLEVFDESLPTPPDPVNPQHYKKGEVECVKAIRSAVVDKKGYSAVATANVIKYLWRYESKGGIQDIEKALWYLNDLLEYEKGKIK